MSSGAYKSEALCRAGANSGNGAPCGAFGGSDPSLLWDWSTSFTSVPAVTCSDAPQVSANGACGTLLYANLDEDVGPRVVEKLVMLSVTLPAHLDHPLSLSSTWYGRKYDYIVEFFTPVLH